MSNIHDDDLHLFQDCEAVEIRNVRSTERIPYRSFCTEDMSGSEEEKNDICGYFWDKFGPTGNEAVEALAKAKGKATGDGEWEPKMETIKYVRLYPSRKTVMRMLATATVSAVDMISNVGGTLGLFTGFSILSGVEIVYWAFRYGQEKMGKGRSRRKIMKKKENADDSISLEERVKELEMRAVTDVSL